MRPGWGGRGQWSGLDRKPRLGVGSARRGAWRRCLPRAGLQASRGAWHPCPPVSPRCCTQGGGEGAGAARSGWGSPHCVPRAAGAFPPPPAGRLVFTQRNPTPAPAKPRSLPNRALPRPCSCPPAPSLPSRLPLSIPSLSLKQRSVGLPATPPRALTSPHRAPGLAVFATRQYHKICPVLHPPPLVSTHLSNSLDGTTWTLHFSFSFLPSPFLFPIFLLS